MTGHSENYSTCLPYARQKRKQMHGSVQIAPQLNTEENVSSFKFICPNYRSKCAVTCHF